jgi:hypothetical protein
MCIAGCHCTIVVRAWLQAYMWQAGAGPYALLEDEGIVGGRVTPETMEAGHQSLCCCGP